MCNLRNIIGWQSRVLGGRWEGVSKSRVCGGRGEERERRERVELPDSLVEKAVSQCGGAGLESALPSPRWQEAEEAV